MVTYLHKETGVKISQESLINFMKENGESARLSFHSRGPITKIEDKNLTFKATMTTRTYFAYQIAYSEDFEVINTDDEFSLEELIMMQDSVRNSYINIPESKKLVEKLHKKISNIYKNR